MGRLIALIAALALGVLIAWAGERTPEPRGADAPATEFSAARAMDDVAVIAREPHAVGTAANQRVRDHLVRRMAALGLSPQVRPGVGLEMRPERPFILGGRVENVVGVLPGRDPAKPALALMAHYDSVPGSPGAADDAAGTAAALEIVRALKARGTPERDVIVLITDGEEAGLLGANHFFHRDPMAKRIGLVLNMETRGGGGRARMFQTSPQNGGLIRLLQANAVRPSSSSLSVFVYEQLPNDTDLTETLAVGTAGLNFSFIDRQFDYHAPVSTPGNLDHGALQDMGQQVLAVAAAAASAPDLPGKAPPAVYSQVFGDLLVAYPDWGGWVLWFATALAVGWAARSGRRAEPFPWTDAARGAGALLFAVLSAVAVLAFARRATGAAFGFMEQRFLLAQVEAWEAAVMLIGVGILLGAAAETARGRRIAATVPVLAGAGSCAFGGLDMPGLVCGVLGAVVGLLAFGRPVSRAGAWTGVLALGLVLGLAAQVFAPPVGFILHWPLAVAALMALATACSTRRGAWTHAALALPAAAVLGWLGGYAHASFVSMDFMPLMALSVLGAAFVIWPLAQPAEGAPPGRWLGKVLVIAGLAVTAWVRFADPYDARRPDAAVVVHLTDADRKQAWRVNGAPELSDWSRTALGGTPERLSHWLYTRPVQATPSRGALDHLPPALTLTAAADGTYRLHAAPSPGGTNVAVRLRTDKPATLVSIGGVATAAKLAAGEWTSLRWSGDPVGPELVLRPSAEGVLDVRASAILPGWPADAAPLPPMPKDVMPWGDTGSTVVVGTRRYAW